MPSSANLSEKALASNFPEPSVIKAADIMARPFFSGGLWALPAFSKLKAIEITGTVLSGANQTLRPFGVVSW